MRSNVKNNIAHYYGIPFLIFLLPALFFLPAASAKTNKGYSFELMADSTRKLPANSAEWNHLSKKDQKFLDMVERKAFNFFWDGFDPKTGLIGDASSVSRRSSIASVGFGLSAFCIADARGWENHQEVYNRVLTVLNSFYKDPNNENDFCVEGTHGFFYHFVNMDTGMRFGKSEVSTIDTGILMAAILNVMEHFKGTEIEDLARKIYLTAEWDWFLQKSGAVAGGWKPENGITGEFKGFNEYIIVYLLGLGSPTHPIPERSWDVWASGNGFKSIKPYSDIDAFLAPGGKMKPLAYLYQFPACWYDFKGKKDHYADYWENGVNALKANKRYSNEWGSAHGYPDKMWGWTACAGKNG
ncbi:MAG: glucoamylase family protein, partial [Daejeonella sp.]